MKVKFTLFILSLLFSLSALSQDQYIFPYGGGSSEAFGSFMKEAIKLTGKEKPRVCFLPTASGDSEAGIIRWYERMRGLEAIPFHQKVWISSYNQQETFEEVLLSMDIIFVGGGNTLNMMAIWQAQGIDVVLKKALEKGIVLMGASAGSLCWFENGTTDSRPKALSVVEGLGFLPFSHSPHYDSEKMRRPVYEENIEKGIFKAGYAMDNRAGIIFKNGKPFRVVSMNEMANCYFVSLKNGLVVEEVLEAEILQ
jgi:dipeptidase E